LVGVVVALSLAQAAASAQQEKGATNKYGNPMKIAPRPTESAITEKDLRTRLYQFADDSMMGRAAGTVGNQKGTDYIAAEAKRLGLEPAGDNGTYFQSLPFGMRYYSAGSSLGAGGQQLRWGTDFTGGPGAATATDFANVQVIFGGTVGDTASQIEPELAAGRFVILLPAPPGAAGQGRGGRGGRGGGGGRGGRGRGGFGANARFAGAAAVATADLDALAPAQLAAITRPPVRSILMQQNQPAAIAPGTALGPSPAPPSFRLTRAAAEKLLGIPLSGARPGAAGLKATGKLVVTEVMTPNFARNVVAILRGTDPVLKEEYVAIGAHNDHDPMTSGGVDHDSLKAYNDALYALRMADGKQVISPTQEMQAAARAKVNLADIRAKNGPARIDSIRNGADDDGSGSMAVLEIAEALATAKVKPKRSILFVWHTGEETGLQGSRWYTDHPTVPLEKVVSQINIDMIGRGRADDIPGGGPDYLAVVGSKRLSDDLSNMVVSSNKQQKKPLKLDYQFDDSVTWAGYNNIYGRSDHANYARKGIPIAFFFTGLHGDYHQLTDEPQYIDYPHYNRITNYIRDLMVNVANGPRPKVRQVAQ
jgi:hypothetical protein